MCGIVNGEFPLGGLAGWARHHAERQAGVEFLVEWDGDRVVETDSAALPWEDGRTCLGPDRLRAYAARLNDPADLWALRDGTCSVDGDPKGLTLPSAGVRKQRPFDQAS